MNNKIKKISLVSALTLSVAIGTIGCNAPSKKIDPRNSMPDRIDGLDNRDIRNTGDTNDLTDQNTNRHLYNDVNERPHSEDNVIGNNSMVDRAERISRKVTELNDIKSSRVIITGDTALVGVDIPNNSNGKITNDLKKKVQDKVKNTDKNINNVMVTADPDLVNRIEGLGTDIKNGKPLSGLGNEIEEIIRRITPKM